MDEKANEKYLVFTVCGKHYALPSGIISEVASLEKIFPLPLVPDYVRGIINRYSVPYVLIDISVLFFKAQADARKVIVLKQDVDKLGFLIDEVTDIADVSGGMLMKTDLDETDASGAVSAFFEWKGSHVLCLDALELISRIKHDFE